MKKKETHDLLIPVLIVTTILPFVMHLAVYRCGYAVYDWYATEDTIADFYCYYKSYFLDITAFFAAVVLAFRLTLYREKTTDIKTYLPLAGYVFFVLLSSLCSVNPGASLRGNFESFESCLVLTSYVILSFYAFQVVESERDCQIISSALAVTAVLFSAIGIPQALGHDPLDLPWAQRLLMSEEAFSQYGDTVENTFSDGYVSLTLYNPNYAGIALAMLSVFFFVLCVTGTRKKSITAYGILSAVLFFLVWHTYARASLLAVVPALLLFFFLQYRSERFKRSKKHLWVIAVALFLAAGLLIALDAVSGFRFLSRFIEKNTREPLEYMTTEPDGIHIGYDGAEYLVWLDQKDVCCRRSDRADEILRGEEIRLPMEDGAKALFLKDDCLALYLAETTLQFIRQDDGYRYQTDHGKITDMKQVDAADLHGLEYLGSARGYIWSRTLPLLENYLLAGSGPDTFAEVFPQHDYAGKIVYSDRPDMVIEKAHNDYLTKWVQTGLPSVICLLAFYALLIARGIRFYQKKALTWNPKTRVGLGCFLSCLVYMTANFFNDSTLQTAPLFWIMAGIALRSTAEKSN